MLSVPQPATPRCIRPSRFVAPCLFSGVVAVGVRVALWRSGCPHLFVFLAVADEERERIANTPCLVRAPPSSWNTQFATLRCDNASRWPDSVVYGFCDASLPRPPPPPSSSTQHMPDAAWINAWIGTQCVLLVYIRCGLGSLYTALAVGCWPEQPFSTMHD